MDQSLRALASRFEQFRKAEREKGGGPDKVLRYPDELKRAAVARVREQGAVTAVARSLGLAPSSLSKWAGEARLSAPARPDFVPIEVVASADEGKGSSLRGVTVSVRDVTISFADETEPAALDALIGTLALRGT